MTKSTRKKIAFPQIVKTLEPKVSQKERKNRKMTEEILPQDQKPKSESSRLRSQPCKNYKTFIPQSKILKKVEFQK